MIDNGVLQRPASRMGESPPAPPPEERSHREGRRSHGVIACLLGLTAFLGVGTLTISLRTDMALGPGTGETPTEAKPQNSKSPGSLVQVTKPTPRPKEETRPLAGAAPAVKPPSKPKPPAPKGFHDFHLGMTRKELHTLVESWADDVTVILQRGLGNSLHNVPRTNGDVKEISIRFNDGRGLATAKYWEYRRSTDLTPQEAQARLQSFTVTFWERAGSSWEELLQPLRERFGPPDMERWSPPLWWSGYNLLAGVYMYNAVRGESLVWTWEDADRTVIAGGTSLGFGPPILHLAFVDGLLAREEERLKKERKETASVVDAIRKGIK
ncbi:MAG: hypothetical protein Q8R32_00500 [bacterium]|nr:hypothetical protein [bacterium]